MELWATLLGLLLIVEGIPWFLSPGKAKKLMRQVAAIPDATLRLCGLAAMFGGLLAVFFARR